MRAILRIIPAHAGFTWVLFPIRSYRGDHPRTRGVYSLSTYAATRPSGSSPHTRGLLAEQEVDTFNYRIIPAHAGFTIESHVYDPNREDHPRTRGVYVNRLFAVSARFGIIPAHAGFTTGRLRTRFLSLDHPRTRGVYQYWPVRAMAAVGSSPHTRGLLPAPGTTHHQGQDHPRTRGVYNFAWEMIASAGGSSPHTRGLQAETVVATPTTGIIPAHAGFTASPWWPRPPTRDHPRTRGVYVHSAEPDGDFEGSSPHTRGLRP